MPKQLLDLSKEESDSLDKISKYWKLSKTDSIKKMIKEYARQFEKKNDSFNTDFNIDNEIKW